MSNAALLRERDELAEDLADLLAVARGVCAAALASRGRADRPGRGHLEAVRRADRPVLVGRANQKA